MSMIPMASNSRLTAEGTVRRILGKDELPIAPAGERILLLPNPPDEMSETGLHLPGSAAFRRFSGRIISGGLQALDKLYDNGIDIGDEVWWGKFAGVIEEWDHLVENGDGPCDDHEWGRLPSPRDQVSAYKCSHCAAVRWVQVVIAANVDDIIGSVEQAERMRRGEIEVVRGQLSDGATSHFYKRSER